MTVWLLILSQQGLFPGLSLSRNNNSFCVGAAGKSGRGWQVGARLSVALRLKQPRASRGEEGKSGRDSQSHSDWKQPIPSRGAAGKSGRDFQSHSDWKQPIPSRDAEGKSGRDFSVALRLKAGDPRVQPGVNFLP